MPAEIISGDAVQLSDDAFRDIFDFLALGTDDVFYHLGCGTGRGAFIAATEYGVKRSIGMDAENERILAARRETGTHKRLAFLHEDITQADLGDATAVLFWFTDPAITYRMLPRLNLLRDGCRVLTIWGPLPGCLPDKVRFPYIINKAPFREAANLREQILAVFGVKCVDFATAWEHAERYTRAIELSDAQNNRFVTILLSLVIWINAKNLGVACGNEIPESIRTYIGILENFYGIEMWHLLEGEAGSPIT